MKTNVLTNLAEIITQCAPGEGMYASPLPGTHCINISQTSRRAKRHWRACFGIVAQGCKEIVLGRQVYRCGAGHFTVTPIDLPVTSRIVIATPAKPFLAMLIDLDPVTLNGVASSIEKELPKELTASPRAFFMGKANDAILEAWLRLGKLLEVPEDAGVLGPLVVKEIIYHVLKGPDGRAIRQFVRSGSKMQKISQAIHTLRAGLTEEVDVSQLAEAALMSRSAFFKHFKEVTALSPIQYQKRLRLLEARRLMTEAGETAEGSAFKVGYNSASQFSREYSRMFGSAPLRDAVKLKATGQPLQQL